MKKWTNPDPRLHVGYLYQQAVTFTLVLKRMDREERYTQFAQLANELNILMEVIISKVAK